MKQTFSCCIKKNYNFQFVMHKKKAVRVNLLINLLAYEHTLKLKQWWIYVIYKIEKSNLNTKHLLVMPLERIYFLEVTMESFYEEKN